MTRGIRNNNPLNIRISNNNWKGKVLVNNDGAFEQFISMEYGFRAALLTIETYILKHGCNTIRKIITRFAPPTDGNNTEKYIQFVCMATNMGGNETLSNHDRRLRDIVWAMAHIESGAGVEDYQSSLEKAFDAFVPREQTEKEYKKKYT
ncbi:MAG: structural protein P5 [Paludibacteraceae bacterium]|nr:structural protein P5 [Paludibacteraceae bacterium]